MDSSKKSFAVHRRSAVTKTYTTQHSTRNNSDISHLLQDEPWDRSPKTDYTYSHSLSYYSHGKDAGLPSPNMSRPRMYQHGHSFISTRPAPNIVVTEDHTDSVQTAASSLVERQEDMSKNQKMLSATRTGSSRRSLGSALGSSHEGKSVTPQSARRSMPPTLNVEGLPPSATRAGTQYGVKWKPEVKSKKNTAKQHRHSRRSTGSVVDASSMSRKQTRHSLAVTRTDYEESYLPRTHAAEEEEFDGMVENEDDVGVEESVLTHEFHYTEPAHYSTTSSMKLYEHSEISDSFKESQLDHLYGLDHSDQEYSDSEVTVTRRRRHRRSASKYEPAERSTLTSLVTTTIAVVTTIITSLSKIIVYPLIIMGKGSTYVFRKCIYDKEDGSLLWWLWVAVSKMITSTGYFFSGFLKSVLNQREDESEDEEVDREVTLREERRVRKSAIYQKQKSKETCVSSLANESENEWDMEIEERESSSTTHSWFTHVLSTITTILLFPLALMRRFGSSTRSLFTWLWAHTLGTSSANEGADTASRWGGRSSRIRTWLSKKQTVTQSGRSAGGELSDDEDDMTDTHHVDGFLHWLSLGLSNLLGWLFTADKNPEQDLHHEHIHTETYQSSVISGTDAAEVKPIKSSWAVLVTEETKSVEHSGAGTDAAATPTKSSTKKRRGAQKQPAAPSVTEKHVEVTTESEIHEDTGRAGCVFLRLWSLLLSVILFPFAILRWALSWVSWPFSGSRSSSYEHQESVLTLGLHKTGTALSTVVGAPFGIVLWLWSSLVHSCQWLFGSDGQSQSRVMSTLSSVLYAIGAIILFPFGVLLWLGSKFCKYMVQGWSWLFGSYHSEHSKVSRLFSFMGHSLRAVILFPFVLLSWIWYKLSSGLAKVGSFFTGGNTSSATAAHGATQGGDGLWTRFSRGLWNILTFIILLPFGLLAWLYRSVVQLYYKWIRHGAVGGWLGQGWLGAAAVHRGVATSAFTDVWLLSQTSYWRRKNACCCLLPILLIPLFLTILYYLWDQGTAEELYGASIGSLAPIGAFISSKAGSINAGSFSGADSAPQFKVPVILEGNETDSALQEKLQTILMALLAQQQQHQEQKFAAEKQAWDSRQQALLASYKAELEKLVRAIVDKEIALLAAKMDNQDKETLIKASEMAAAAAMTEEQLSSRVQSLLLVLLQQYETEQEIRWNQQQAEWKQLQEQQLSSYQQDLTVLVTTMAEREAVRAAVVSVKEESEKQQAAASVSSKNTEEKPQPGPVLDETLLASRVESVVASLLHQQEAAEKARWDALVAAWAASRDKDHASLLTTLQDYAKEAVDSQASALLLKMEEEKSAMLAAAALAGKEATSTAGKDAEDKVAAAGKASEDNVVAAWKAAEDKILALGQAAEEKVAAAWKDAEGKIAIAGKDAEDKISAAGGAIVVNINEAGTSAVKNVKESATIVASTKVELGVGTGTDTGAGQGYSLSEEDLQAKVAAATAALLKQHQNDMQTLWVSQQTSWQQAQEASFSEYKAGVDAMVAKAIEAQLAAGLQSVRSETSDLFDKLSASQKEQAGHIAALQVQLQDVIGKAQTLSAELQAARADMKENAGADSASYAANVVNLEAKLASLHDDIGKLQAAHAALALQLKDCCKNDTALAALIAAGIQSHMAAMMAGSDGGEAKSGGSGSFMAWLQSQFAKRSDMDDRFSVLAAHIQEDMKNDAVAAAIAAVASKASSGKSSSSVNIGLAGASGMTEERVQHLIQEALLLFAADKTGQVDYALESAGGSIISTRCSETYHRHTAQLSLFGIPLWYASNSPRTVIQPDIHPGQCWAFRGKHGFLVIQLVRPVKPTSFSLEHIPRSLSPTGRIDSAPKDFSVLGLVDEWDKQGKVLGNYTYTDLGDPLQYFLVADPDPGQFSIIELRILSNHGNPDYTCLYRFRVHGIPEM